ncbi:hypothetical protein RRF57_004411 [Xylaria bambusicola]|uniref:Uncharacterized protein n=1 Tax=Xylaria bambusicola TaxID=326684 RepID=A0AAN7ULU1_9PEZI
MLIRRLGARVPRGPGSVTAKSSTFLILGKTPSLHSGTNLRYGLSKIEKGQQLSRAYSNFAPTDPYSHYDAYAQPPKSRVSRLKDMAIGSVLTIIAYLAYRTYSLWDVVKHAEEELGVAIKLEEIYSHYDQLLEQAEAVDDKEKIRSLFKERAMALVRAILRNQEDQTINELGPLPTLPEDYDCQSHGTLIFGDGDTVMLMPQRPPLDEANPLSPRHMVAVAINAFAEDVGINDDAMGLVNYRTPKVHEIICRSRYMLEKLRKEGTIDGMTLVTVYLWDFEFMFVYDKGIVMVE